MDDEDPELAPAPPVAEGPEVWYMVGQPGRVAVVVTPAVMTTVTELCATARVAGTRAVRKVDGRMALMLMRVLVRYGPRGRCESKPADESSYGLMGAT